MTPQQEKLAKLIKNDGGVLTAHFNQIPGNPGGANRVNALQHLGMAMSFALAALREKEQIDPSAVAIEDQSPDAVEQE